MGGGLVVQAEGGGGGGQNQTCFITRAVMGSPHTPRPPQVPRESPITLFFTTSKILLPSAVHLEERLTVSQAVPEPGQQSVRQKHIVWGFCQWQTQQQAVGSSYPGIQAVIEW